MSMVSQAPLLTPLQQTWMPFPWVHLDVVGQVENLERSWELLFERPISLPEDDYEDYDFGQFAVTREAMQRRPVGFWQRAWRALCSRGNYQHLPGTRYLSPIVDFADSKTMSDWRGYHSQTNERTNERTNENNNKRTARHAHISTKATTR